MLMTYYESLKSKIAVVIIARNEEKYIEKTLTNLQNQDLPPYRIIVVNDGSTDTTGEIASRFNNVEIVKRENTQNLVAKKELASTFNAGLEKLHEDKDCEFVMIAGADVLFPQNYLSLIINRMKTNPNIAVSSGIIQDEFSIEPRGSGRVVRMDFWRKLGLVYPINYGFEAYLLWKARSMEYETASYFDLIANSQRKTGSQYDPKLYFYYGIGLKALGYTIPYTIVKALLFAKKKPKGAVYMLRGFFSKYDELYEPELRNYVKKTQYRIIMHFKFEYIKRIINTLRYR